MQSQESKSAITRLTRAAGLTHEDLLDLAEEIAGEPILTIDDLDQHDTKVLIERLEDS